MRLFVLSIAAVTAFGCAGPIKSAVPTAKPASQPSPAASRPDDGPTGMLSSDGVPRVLFSLPSDDWEQVKIPKMPGNVPAIKVRNLKTGQSVTFFLFRSEPRSPRLETEDFCRLAVKMREIGGKIVLLESDKTRARCVIERGEERLILNSVIVGCGGCADPPVLMIGTVIRAGHLREGLEAMERILSSVREP